MSRWDRWKLRMLISVLVIFGIIAVWRVVDEVRAEPDTATIYASANYAATLSDPRGMWTFHLVLKEPIEDWKQAESRVFEILQGIIDHQEKP